MLESLCVYELEPKGSKIILNLDCKSCKLRGESRRWNCFEMMIRTVEKEFSINSILMKNYSLTQFQGDAIDIIKEIAGLRNEIRTMKERRNKNLNDSNKSKRGKRKTKGGKGGGTGVRCNECPASPKRLFARPYGTLYPDFKPFVDTLLKSVERLNRFIKKSSSGKRNELKPVCLSCAGDSYKDLTFLFIQYKKLSRGAAFKGFSVVME
jgi:hypothetical protein